MAWWHQTTSHQLNLNWHRFMSPWGDTRPQWVNLHCSYTYRIVFFFKSHEFTYHTCGTKKKEKKEKEKKKDKERRKKQSHEHISQDILFSMIWCISKLAFNYSMQVRTLTIIFSFLQVIGFERQIVYSTGILSLVACTQHMEYEKHCKIRCKIQNIFFCFFVTWKFVIMTTVF